MTQTPKRTRRPSRLGVGGNQPPHNIMTTDDCVKLAAVAFNEVDTIKKLDLSSVQHMAAACFGYHENMSKPPSLAHYIDMKQDKSRSFLWLAMYDFFMPKETRAKVIQPPTTANDELMEVQQRRRSLIERGLELASCLAYARLTLDAYKADVGMWETPLSCYCSDGFSALADHDVTTTLMNGKAWIAVKPAKKATKQAPATSSELERWFASTAKFVAMQKVRANPKPVAPAQPGAPATATAVASAQSATNGAATTEPEAGRDTRLPVVVAATQTIGGWANAIIKELRSTDGGKLVYPTLKTLNDQDREPLVMLMKLLDDMVRRSVGDTSKPAMRAEVPIKKAS